MAMGFLAGGSGPSRKIFNLARRHLSLGLLVSLLVSLLGISSAQTGSVPLTIIPQNSLSTWSLQKLSGVTADTSPPSFRLQGPVVLNISQADSKTFQPTEVVWSSANMTTDPATWTAVLSSAVTKSSIANLTMQNPQMWIYGGKFNVENLNYSFTPDNAVLLVQSLTEPLLSLACVFLSGSECAGGKFNVENLNYSFTPDNAVLLVQSLTGTFLGSNVNSQNLQVPVDPDNMPTIDGQLISRGPQFELLSSGVFEVPLSDLIRAAGGGEQAGELVGDSYLQLNMTMQAIGPPGRGPPPPRRAPPRRPPRARVPPPPLR